MRRAALLLPAVILLAGCGREYTTTPKVIDHDEAYISATAPQTEAEETTAGSTDELEATVYDVSGRTLLLGPQKKSVSFRDGADLTGIKPGDKVKVRYDGYVLESYPEIINDAYSVEVTEKADRSYTYVTRSGETASFSLLVPEGWTVTDISYPPPDDEEVETDWGIDITSPSGSYSISWHTFMGICGTGLTWENTTINGMQAIVYRNEGSEAWSSVYFNDYPDFWVSFSFEDEEKWQSSSADIMAMLDTLEFM